MISRLAHLKPTPVNRSLSAGYSFVGTLKAARPSSRRGLRTVMGANLEQALLAREELQKLIKKTHCNPILIRWAGSRVDRAWARSFSMVPPPPAACAPLAPRRRGPPSPAAVRRLAWHDAGTYDKNVDEPWPKKGGATASIRFQREMGHGARARACSSKQGGGGAGRRARGAACSLSVAG